MSNKIAHISLNLEGKNSSGRIFISEPNSETEKIAGRLFALIEIEGEKKSAKKLIDFIIAELNEKYYGNEKLELREIMSAIKVESIFESILIETDSRLVDFLVKEKTKIDSFTLHATVGILYQNELHFASIGQNQALLLYLENGRYQLLPVKKENDQETKEKKLFSSIISGDLPPKALFLFANQRLAEYIFNDEILDIITKLSPLSAAEQIKSTLSKINKFASFAGIIIKNCQNSENSKITEISDLRKTEIQTEKILRNNTNLEKENNLALPLEKIKDGAKDLAARLESLEKEDKKEMSPKDKKKKKIILAVIIVCLVGLLFNIGYLQINKKIKAKNEARQKQVELIEEKLAEIQASLLYGEKDKAKEAHLFLKDVFASLTEKDRKKIDNFNQLEEDYLKQGQILSGVKEVSEEKIKALAEMDQDISTAEVLENYLYLAHQNEIYKVNISTGQKEKLGLESQNIKTSLQKDNALYFLGDKELLNLSTNKKSQINYETEKVVGFSIYLDKLYLYDQEKEELFRLSLKNEIYETPQSRLKSEATTISFAIDLSGPRSDVYLLKSDGSLLKFYDGQKQDFQAEKAEPELSGSQNKLYVKKDIYILDKTHKRIIVYGKDGKFVRQYSSDKFGEINNLAIDEKNKKIYIINQKQVNFINME